MSKAWAGKLLLGLIGYFTIFVLIITYGSSVAESFGGSIGGETTFDVSLNSTFGSQSSCSFPRYRYNQNGDSSKYIFDINNLDCDISAGAISPNVCDYIEGCNWANTTTGWLWFSSTTQHCNGTINQTYYNDGEINTENFCNMDGLQGDTETNTCGVLGCTSYAPRNDAKGGVLKPLVMLDTVGNLFLFRYDFGFETDLYDWITNFIIFYIPFLLLIMSIYILSPLSN